ncbi:Pentatricopeptide repeat [Dillenia turbinata]|uniref:Pentatricopeptide repeat n=1 Tax=Dillenia turbinata TaxID=194707 RepID=A0AAN8W9E7_9MAGN
MLTRTEPVASKWINIHFQASRVALRVSHAEALFGSLHRKNLVTWNAMISDFAHNGHSVKIIELFNELQTVKGLKPDGITFLNVLSACWHMPLETVAAEIAAAKVIQLEGDNEYVFVMMSNPYAYYNKWVDAEGKNSFKIDREFLTLNHRTTSSSPTYYCCILRPGQDRYVLIAMIALALGVPFLDIEIMEINVVNFLVLSSMFTPLPAGTITRHFAPGVSFKLSKKQKLQKGGKKSNKHNELPGLDWKRYKHLGKKALKTSLYSLCPYMVPNIHKTAISTLLENDGHGMIRRSNRAATHSHNKKTIARVRDRCSRVYPVIELGSSSRSNSDTTSSSPPLLHCAVATMIAHIQAPSET